MRPSREEWAMQLAVITAQRATCCRRQVGCVLLNQRGHVMATGYNGAASKQPHCNDCVGGEYPHACQGAWLPSGIGLDSCQAIHAEQNALLQCSNVYEIHSCFVTLSPCITCCKLLLNTSCQGIYFLDEYIDTSARHLWEAAGRVWTKLEIQNELAISALKRYVAGEPTARGVWRNDNQRNNISDTH